MKKSVCFICPHFYPALGGVEKHVNEVSQELIAKNWQVSVLTVQEKPEDKLLEIIDGIRVIRIPLSAQQSKVKLWKWVANTKLFNLTSTIYHVHDVAWWLLPVIFTIRRQLYCTFHGWEGKYPIRWQAKLHRWLVAQVCQGTIHVGDFIQHFYWDKPTLVTYGGVKQNQHVEQRRINAHSPQIVFLGRLEPENAVELYIQTLHELHKQGIHAEVTWVGDGALRKHCEVVGEVTGIVTNVFPYLEKADLVFANSYLSLLEVQAAKKLACALYQNPLKKDYIQSYPGSRWMIHAATPESIASQIRVFLAEPSKFADTIAQAADFAHAQTWRKVADTYVQLWGEHNA